MVKDPSIKHEIVKLLKENIEETFTYTGNGFLDKIQTAQAPKAKPDRGIVSDSEATTRQRNQ